MACNTTLQNYSTIWLVLRDIRRRGWRLILHDLTSMLVKKILILNNNFKFRFHKLLKNKI